VSRETAYSALFALLQGLKAAAAVKTCDRRVRLIDEMSPPELPALFMAVSHQGHRRKEGLPAVRSLKALVFLYAENPDSATAAGVQLNGLLDALDAALEPPAGQETQTLGGVVHHARIEGEIEVYEGVLGQRAAAIVPVVMLVP
jgi:hypothetical protein